jgi:hypothetical protein
MIAQLMLAVLVPKTREDEEVAVTALAESVTKTVSTQYPLSLSPTQNSLFLLLRQHPDRGLVTIYAPWQPFISLQTITPTTRSPYPLSHVLISAHYTHGSVVRSLTLSGMDLVTVTVVMILSPRVACRSYYRVLMKHHVNINNEKDEARHFSYEQY